MKSTLRTATLAVLCIIAFGLPLLNATTVTTLLDRVRDQIGETDSTNSRFTNTDLRDFLTQGTYVVSNLVGGVEKTSRIVPAGKKTAYALPTGYYATEGVLIKRGYNYRPLGRVSISELGDTLKLGTASADRPLVYSVHNDTLWLFPTLLDYGKDTIYFFYYAKASSLDSNSQTTELPFWTDALVIDYACYLCAARDMTASEIQAWWSGFYEKVNRMVYTYIRKPQVQETITQ